jgi:tRNA G10  N-methylase Trm11
MVYKSLFILGRQPAIGRAELESLLGVEHVQPLGEHMASDIAPDQINFERIGSSIRLAKILTPLPTTQWPQIARYIAEHLPEHLDYLPTEGKLKLGLSVFDLPVKIDQLFRTGLELKKICKNSGRSVRLVPNTDPALSSAAVLHNQLTGMLGWELLLVRDGNQTWLAQTVKVQDITAYARRDQNRPKRDARVGMLPPKLAQTIVNLAVGQIEGIGSRVEDIDNAAILDPFCGTGVILQEALLMGYNAYGSDIEPRMIDYSRENLEWLATHGKDTTPLLEVGDATTHQWAHPFSVVASETYLGRPLSSWPGSDTLHEIIGTCNLIIEKFLKNIANQTQSGKRLCLAVPAWRGPNGQIHHLPLLDHLGQIGYNRLRFEHAKDADLVYFRPEQLVARELLVITRN